MIDVGVLGATGTVGQQFVRLLDRHPWFRLTWLAASERSAGKRYDELAWRLPSPLPPEIGALRVAPLDAINDAPPLLFSALDASVAGEAEVAYAASGRLVVSNARNHRMDPLVPLLIPEVNPDHADLLDVQRKARGGAWTGGGIVTNPNCAVIVVAMVLAALRQFRPSRVFVTTMQALSGAGYPGVPSLDALGNVIPYIGGGEEEKIENEAVKLLGEFDGKTVRNAPFLISSSVNRVPVPDGHTAVLSLELATKPTVEEVAAALDAFTSEPQLRNLPSAPVKPIILHRAQDRPQPRLDANTGNGMPVHCGRVRACPVLGYKLVALGHNVVRGAAGAALLNAELLMARGMALASSGDRRPQDATHSVGRT